MKSSDDAPMRRTLKLTSMIYPESLSSWKRVIRRGSEENAYGNVAGKKPTFPPREPSTRMPMACAKQPRMLAPGVTNRRVQRSQNRKQAKHTLKMLPINN
jgi:hypothetical protein